ncbi:MAG: hypothetical protein ABIQ64_02365 [Candidatus Saccharimonadales bacterium]
MIRHQTRGQRTVIIMIALIAVSLISLYMANPAMAAPIPPLPNGPDFGSAAPVTGPFRRVTAILLAVLQVAAVLTLIVSLILLLGKNEARAAAASSWAKRSAGVLVLATFFTVIVTGALTIVGSGIGG